MQIFFDDLALPRLMRSQLVETPEMKSQRAGYSSTGTPSNLQRDPLDARRDRPARRASAPARARELTALLAKLAELPEGPADPAAGCARGARAADRALRAPARAHPYLDPIDLRFRNRVRCRSRPPRR
mgnify:CR=1 FL=1